MEEVATSVGRFTAGLGYSLLLVAAFAAAGDSTRRILVPHWRGAWARLTEVIAGLTVIAVPAQALGLLGLFRIDVVTFVVVLVAAGIVFAAGRPDPTIVREPSPPRDRTTTAATVVAGVIASVTAARWIAATAAVLDKGMYSFDTLFYHGPLAAKFAQMGNIGGIIDIIPGEAVGFHPALTELLNGIGILAYESDFLTPLANLFWLGLFYLAAWCLGAAAGSGPVGLAFAGVLTGTPGMVESQAGTGLNDIAGMALLTAAAAFIARSRRNPQVRVLAALAAGMCAGTKLSLLVPAVMVALAAVVVAPKGMRRVAIPVWFFTAFAAGGVWYLRNLMFIGNPIPALELDIGPVHFPSPTFAVIDRFDDSLIETLTPSWWDSTYQPGLIELFSPAWWIIVAVALAGMALAVLPGRPRTLRAMGVAGLIAVVTYLLTPGTGTTLLFALNLRYGLPALALGTALAGGIGRWPRGRVAAVAVAGAATLFAAGQRSPFAGARWQDGVAITVAGAAITGVVVALARIDRRRAVQAGLSLAVVTALLAPTALRRVEVRYQERRYRTADGDLGAAYRWAQSVTGARIGFVGTYEHYALFGHDLSNDVSYVALPKADGSFVEVDTCPDFRRLVNAGGYDYVVVTHKNLEENPPARPELEWVGFDAAADPVVRRGNTAVFEINGELSPVECEDV